MKICRMQCNELYEFIRKGKEQNTLATICSKNEAEFVADGNIPLYFKFSQYDDETIKQLFKQSKEWSLKYRVTEHWDSSYDIDKADTVKEFFGDIKPNHILVANNKFAGVIDYSKDLGNNYGLFFALTSDYVGEPIHLGFWEGYGSSDKDMMYEKHIYLVKIS